MHNKIRNLHVEPQLPFVITIPVCRELLESFLISSKKRGRPIGSTNIKKQTRERNAKLLKEAVTAKFIHENSLRDKKYCSEIDLFNQLMIKEKQNYDVSNDFKFPFKSMKTRIARNSISANGTNSPIIFIEHKFVDLILCMSNIKRSLKPSECLMLINELIDGTEIQNHLIDWKINKNIFHKDRNDLGKLGWNYWRSFLKRNSDTLKSKLGRNYAYDRSNFSNYLNFADMYDHIERILVEESKIAERIPQPVWMNLEAKEVTNEMDADGCKVTINITRPDMALVLDECGCNLSQEGDSGNRSSQLVVGGTKHTAYDTIATKHNHFTVLGITRLDGVAIMCVIIINGKKHSTAVELGIDTALLKNNVVLNESMTVDDEIEFLENNVGSGKLFPGAPVCHYKGIEIPAYVTFNSSGGMDASILTGIFKRLDDLGIYNDDRANGLIPFMLLDGHGSRFDLEFLEYVNDDKNRWNPCIGVPYGTALWQVADSEEQNGKFKHLLTKAKKETYKQRQETLLQDLCLVRTDIVPILNICWPPAFADVENNLKAISKKGWYPYNRMLLLHPIIRATMTEEMIEKEKILDIFPVNRVPSLHMIQYEDSGNGKISIRCRTSEEVNTIPLNFSGGVTSKFVSSTIMSDLDRQRARERNQKKRDEGKTLKERLSSITKHMTSGLMTLKGRNYHLNKTVLEHAKDQKVVRDKKKLEGRQAKDLEYLQLCYKADIAKKNNPSNDVKEWYSIKDIAAYLRPLLHKNDKSLPTSREGIETSYIQYSCRRRFQLVADEKVMENFSTWLHSDEAKKEGESKKRKKKKTANRKNETEKKQKSSKAK